MYWIVFEDPVRIFPHFWMSHWKFAPSQAIFRSVLMIFISKHFTAWGKCLFFPLLSMRPFATSTDAWTTSACIDTRHSVRLQRYPIYFYLRSQILIMFLQDCTSRIKFKVFHIIALKISKTNVKTNKIMFTFVVIAVVSWKRKRYLPKLLYRHSNE